LAERVSEFRLNEETGPYTTSKSVPYTSVTKRFVA
jgi:hypothetical protein